MNRIYRPSLEVNIVDHCNLHCANCDHFSPLAEERAMPSETLAADLSVLAEVMHVRELQFVGGEPLLHPQLSELLRIGRSSGIADQITLITNGLLLHQVGREIFDLVDGLWISIYPGVRQRIQQSKLEELAREHGIWIWIKETASFQERFLNSRNSDAELVRYIYFSCLETHIYSCHSVHDGRYYKCPPSIYMGRRVGHLGEILNSHADSVALHENPNLREELSAFIASPEPLKACEYCLGSTGCERPHRQLNRKQLLDEMRPDGRSIRARMRSDFIPPPT